MYLVYFDICASVVLIFLIISIAGKKMRSGIATRLYVFMLVMALFTVVFDIFTVILQQHSDDGAHNHVLTLYFINTLYILFHNLTIPAYLLFIIGLTDTWHKLKDNPLEIAVMLIPQVLIVLVLIVNLFTGSVFYFDADSQYARGSMMFVLYILAFINMVICTAYIVKYRKNFSRFKYISLIIMLPMVVVAVAIQWFFPDLLVEMFACALAMFLVLTTVQRPEELQDEVTLLKNNSAYFAETNQDFSNNKPFTEIIINISNYMTLHQILSYDGAAELLRKAADELVTVDRELKTRAEMYHIQKGRFRFVVSGERRALAEEAAEKINAALKKSVTVNGLELNFTAYVCITECPEDIADFKALRKFGADLHERLSYTGKVLKASEIAEKKDFELGSVIDEIIENAIANRNFKLYYQPIYSTEEKRFVSAEALLRLQDEKYGFIPPDIFIVAAERSGAIHKIGNYVTEEVCRFISSGDFKNLGLNYIEMNLSVAQCMSPQLSDNIIQIIKRYGVDPKLINLEITETAVEYAQNIMTENIDRLYEAGFTFSLDDYGTGYSNIKRVASLPLEIVKLDKTFADSRNDPRMWIVLSNTVKMLKAMDMNIVVEGVETVDALGKFEELKCDYIQGYYFSKPIPEEDFVRFILRSKTAV